MATLKQKVAFKKTVENHGSVSKSMVDAGYRKATAKNPKNLTESKGWQELMGEYLPDKLLAKRHKELLNKREQLVVGEEVIDSGPETMAVSKGLDMAYKLKGTYAPEKSASLNVNINGRNTANPDIDALVSKFEEELKSKFA